MSRSATLRLPLPRVASSIATPRQRESQPSPSPHQQPHLRRRHHPGVAHRHHERPFPGDVVGVQRQVQGGTAFLYRVQRQVSKTGQVHFQGNRYAVPGFLVGQKVELRYDPFDLRDVEVWFNSAGHQEIQARLNFALQNRFPTLITGDVGAGKSTAVRAFIQSLDPNLYLTAYLPNPNLTIQTLFAYLLTTFRVSATYHPRGLGERLRSTLADLAERGSRPILIVDEAHLLSNRILHELRFWLNADMDAATPFTLVLIGQSDLRQRLQLKEFEVLDQRIQVRYHLQPLDLAESAAYIKHHLRVVGVERSPFSDSFIHAAYQFSHGVARQLNRVCLNGLVIGFAERKQVLDDTDARRAIADLDRSS